MPEKDKHYHSNDDEQVSLTEDQKEYLDSLPEDLAADIRAAWTHAGESRPDEEGSPDTFPAEWMQQHGDSDEGEK